LTCATCIHRWFGVVSGQAQWFCRKNLKLKRGELPVIGNDAQLKAAKNCKEWKK